MNTYIELKNHMYLVLACEKQLILHPCIFGIRTNTKNESEMDFGFHILLDNYRLALKSMWVCIDTTLPVINGCIPKCTTQENKQVMVYDKLNIPLQYSGSIQLVNTIEKEYKYKNDYPCFCYKTVYEYIFDHGILITTIDHSKAMIRIRKNIDLGYRDLENGKDMRCIQKFISTSFVGNYKNHVGTRKRKQRLDELIEEYKEDPCIRIEIPIFE